MIDIIEYYRRRENISMIDCEKLINFSSYDDLKLMEYKSHDFAINIIGTIFSFCNDVKSIEERDIVSLYRRNHENI